MLRVVAAPSRAALSLAALALTAGCFAPDPIAGAPCATGVPEDQRCPAGLICVQHDGLETCAFEDLDDPAADRDLDGVADEVDNCPDTVNADQADEDRDRTGDVCDPCPPFTGTEDADGDGVGDACDPNPNDAGDQLIAFTGFAGPLPQTWRLTGVFLPMNGDGLATASDEEYATATFASPATSRIEVRATARLVEITATGENLGAVSLVERYQPSADRGLACQLSSLASGEQQQLRIFNLDRGIIVDTAPHPVEPLAELDLRLRRTGQQYNCRAASPVLELAGTASITPASPRIGVRVRGASAIFHWVMIVASP